MATMRISGLASGMDIDSIVSDMMKVKRMPLDKLKQQKQIMEWQRDDYREMNTLLLDFRSELTQMKLTTQYRTRTTISTDESKVTATASSAASLSSYSISSVSQLASAETRISQAVQQTNIDSFDPSKGIYGQKESFVFQPSLETDIWKTGAILNKSIPVQQDTNIVSFGDMASLDVSLRDSWSVKVNGTGFDVVASDDVNFKPAENQVQLKTDGTMIFGKTISKDSVVKVDYVANNRKDTLSISSNSTSLKLNQGAINTIQSITFIEKAEGTDPVTRTFTIGNVDGNGLYEILDGTTVVGKLNKLTGDITEITNMPKPVEGSKTTMSLEVTYDHKYTSFEVDTSTSSGDRHDSFLVSGSDSLNTVINKVNSANTGVSMFFDTATGKMSLTRTETGDFNTETENPEKRYGSEIGFTGSLSQLLQLDTSTVTVPGENAAFTINGLATTRSSNTFDINGVTFTLKKTFNSGDTPTPVTIAINNDSNAVYENIKTFIDKYNELIGKIQAKIQEERYRDYTPLTDEQRESLSDKQQELWEEKAKSGLLRRDSTLSSLLSSMRTDFYGSVESEDINPVYNQLAKIGIKTTANWIEGGKLEINEAELKAAIEADPESVEKLFNASGTTNGQKGIAQRLYDTVGNTMDIITEKAGKSYSTNKQFTIGKQLDNLEDQIDAYEDRMTALEDRYYSQFTAMEKAIQQANQQSAYIMNNFFA